MKFVNVGNALKVTCVGFAAGVLLRVVQMLYFFDYDTGFYTDGGVMAWISLGVPVLTGLLASWMCFRARRYFGPYVPRRNVMAGIAALLSGAVLILSGVLQWVELRSNVNASGEYTVLHMLLQSSAACSAWCSCIPPLAFSRERTTWKGSRCSIWWGFFGVWLI